MKPKILFIGSFLSSSTGSFGVSENLAANLAKEGFQVKTVSKKRNKIFRLIDIIKSVSLSGFDIVHIDVFSGQAFRIAEISSYLAKLRGKPLIITLHGGRLNEFWEEAAVRIEKVFKRADQIQTPSIFLKEFFSSKGFEVVYCPNSINLERFPDLRKERKPFSLLWVRAFSPIYQPIMAVKVLEDVKKSFPETRLTMVGPDKGMLGEVTEYIKSRNLENEIEITGPVPNNKLSDYYNSHSVFINTTSYESFGVALVEAASCGIPIVSTSVGEIPYIWNNEENILLCGQEDTEGMAAQVKKLFQSESLRNSIAQAGNNRSKAFSWLNIRKQWLDTFQRFSK